MTGFDHLVARHRRELHLHCYRMLGNVEEAEDAVQETLLKAWRKQDTFTGDPSGRRTWLYRIATNTRIDAARGKAREPSTVDSPAEVPWLQPYPDNLPEEQAVARETIALAANRMPCAASYLRRPGESEFRAFKFDVLRVADNLIVEVTTFDPTLFPQFGLALTV